ncbi:hypothetical protein [Mesorhizobium sp. LNHC209A00]|uniref:hypothetical protein n=1 Tax=Mesorhizobium TaxID=68287 RepID=UPI0003CFD779|nr:hypothetical protein [Mesorhizobium sp. LNHC209A00]ESZ01867.1 hypothetical protein X738_01710 [Mesorhizobium sp. LNHC209A00]
MDDRYDLMACIDFDADSFAISIPILKRRNSNYSYIPKTDSFFNVLDFYEVLDLGYSLKHVDASDERPVQIGHKAPVPILENGSVHVLDPEWTEGEIRSRLPRLGNEAVKAFLSLRSRIGSAGFTPADHADINAAMDDLLSQPVRSRYWISKFSALVRSTFDRGTPPPDLLEKVEAARLNWLEKFSAKSSLKLVQGILEIPHLKLQPTSANRVMLHRFEGMLLTKGIFISRTELRAYEGMFPDGIFEAIKQETGGQYDFWSRRNAISEFIAQQTYEHVYPTDSTQGRIHEPDRWTVGELSALLLFFDVVAGEDTGLDNSRQYFHPLFDKCLEQVQMVLGDRYRLTNVVFRTQPPPPWFLRDLMEVLQIVASQFPSNPDQWLDNLRDVIELHRKLVVVSKIVRPNTSTLDDADVVFEGIDYSLLAAVNNAVSTRNVSALRAVLKPDPQSVL